MNDQAQAELKKIFNGRFSTSESTRANYARGEDTYDPVLSKAVVFPETNEEVSKILTLCNKHKIPVVPFGTGMNGAEFARKAMHEAGEAIVPGSAFGETCQNYVRFSFAASRDNISQALENVKKMLTK